MILKEGATIRSGLVLARKILKEKTEYCYLSLNLKSIDPKEYINKDTLDVVYAKEPLSGDYLTGKGDIIVRLSTPYTAVLINEDTENLVIPSNFVVIKTRAEIILPEYLVWLLNTESVRKKVYENATSNMLGSVTAKYYQNLEIDLPSVSEQQKIADIYCLSRKEISLLYRLAGEKEKYYAQILEQINEQMRKGKRYDNKR